MLDNIIVRCTEDQNCMIQIENNLVLRQSEAIRLINFVNFVYSNDSQIYKSNVVSFIEHLRIKLRLNMMR